MPATVAPAVAAGGHHTFVARAGSETLWSWGSNGYGQLGLGSTADHLTPTPVP